MDTGMLTWYQALQLVALGPCLFIVFFLMVTTRNMTKVVVPVLYFLSLACCFILPLADAAGVGGAFLATALSIGKDMAAAISFLLIVEFITGNIPSVGYWAILALPLVGGSSINYVAALSNGDEICVYEHLCTVPLVFRQLYEIFSSSLIFLLTVVHYSRLRKAAGSSRDQDRHKYAIIYSLIMLNLLLLAIKLLYISGHVAQERAEIAATVVRIGFIYLVQTFVFRVFDRQLEIAYERVPTIAPAVPSERDIQLAETIRKLLSQEKIYREMELSREGVAKRLAVSENQLSRVVNKHFSMNFSMLMNSGRIQEAKERLNTEDTAITTIAFEVGFSSIPSFNRVFKQMTGLSPTEYRNRRKR